MLLDQKLFLERSLAAQNSQKHQTAEDHTAWNKSGFTFRSLCHYNKIYVVWKQCLDGPQVLGRFRVINLELSTQEGLGVCIESDVGEGIDGTQWVNHNPTRLFGLPVFAHIPYLCEVSYTPEGRNPDHFITRIPIVIKTTNNPSTPKVGNIYVTQIGEFRATYPELAELKL